MKKVPVLNWYGKDRKMVRGLRALFKDKTRPTFATIRLGLKWAGRLKPGDDVQVSISDNPKRPKVIGSATVISVEKTTFSAIHYDTLKENIGARTFSQALDDMISVYGEKKVKNSRFRVSVIRLLPVYPTN